MIRYLHHRWMWHRITVPGRGYRNFYHCRTCNRGWNGLFYRGVR